jgi:hypothetical protein
MGRTAQLELGNGRPPAAVEDGGDAGSRNPKVCQLATLRHGCLFRPSFRSSGAFHRGPPSSRALAVPHRPAEVMARAWHEPWSRPAPSAGPSIRTRRLARFRSGSLPATGLSCSRAASSPRPNLGRLDRLSCLRQALKRPVPGLWKVREHPVRARERRNPQECRDDPSLHGGVEDEGHPPAMLP